MTPATLAAWALALQLQRAASGSWAGAIEAASHAAPITTIWRTPVLLRVELASEGERVRVYHHPGQSELYTYFNLADGARVEYVADHYDGLDYWIYGTVSGTSLQGWMVYDYDTFRRLH